MKEGFRKEKRWFPEVGFREVRWLHDDMACEDKKNGQC